MAQDKVIFNLDVAQAKENAQDLANSLEKLKKINTDDSIKSMKQELKAAKDLASQFAKQFGAESQSFKTAAQYVANLRDRMEDANKTIDAFNPDNKMQALVSAGRGAVGAIQGVSGAMAFLGVQSESAQETIAKLQGLMAFSDALNSIDDLKNGFTNFTNVVKGSTLMTTINSNATKAAAFIYRLFGINVNTAAISLKTFSSALVATGIGAAVIAVGFLVQKFQELSEAADDAAEAEKKAIELATKYANISRDTELASLDRNEKLDLARLKQKGATEEEIFNTQQRYNRLRLEAEKRYQAEVQKDNDASLAASKNVKEAEGKIELEKAQFAADQAEKSRQKQKEIANKSKADREKAKAEADRIAEEAKRKQEDDLKQIAEYNEEATKSIAQSMMSARGVELDDLKRDYLKKKKLLEDYHSDTTILTAEYNIKKAGIEKKYSDEIDAYITSKLEEKLDEYDKQRVDINKEIFELSKGATEEKRKELEAMRATLLDEINKLQNLDINSSKAETTLINTQIDNRISEGDTPDQRRTKLTSLYQAEVNVENAAYEAKKARAANNKAELERIEAEHKKKLGDMEIGHADDMKAIDDSVKETKLNNLSAISGAMGSIGQLIGEQTVAGKAMAIGQATIDTYVGANKALAQGGIFGIASAVAVIATGLLNVKKIISTKVGNKDTAGGGASAGGALSQVPIINTQQLSQQKTMDVRVVNQKDMVVKTYVVEKDLVTQQEKSNFWNKYKNPG